MKAAMTGKALKKVCRWFGARKLKIAAILVIVGLIIPQSSQSQIIPSPCCAILSAGLSSIASAITNVVGNALNAINTTMTSIEAFQRAVVWPQNLINRAKDVVRSVQEIFNQIRGLGQIDVASATLPNTQQLEHTLLSGDSGRISSVGSQYAAVYSTVPLLNGDIARLFFQAVVEEARVAGLLSDEHFSVDGTLIEAWASQKSFQKKDREGSGKSGDSGNEGVDFHGEKRTNETHESKTDPDARDSTRRARAKNQALLCRSRLDGESKRLARSLICRFNLRLQLSSLSPGPPYLPSRERTAIRLPRP